MGNDINSYISYLEIELNYSKHTITNYRRDLNDFLNFTKQKKKNSWRLVNYSLIRDYLNYLYQKNYKAKTTNRRLSAIRSFFKYLKVKKLIEQNPLELVTNRKEEKKIPNYLHYYELEKMLAAVNQDQLGIRNKVIIEILYATGMRVGEVVMVKINDIDLKEKTIKVFGKGRKERIVLFGENLKELLIKYLEVRKNLDKLNSNILLLNKNGKPLTDRGIRFIIEQLGKKAGLLKKISPHVFRHTFATHMLDAGADLKVVQELLGHESISSTGIYTHVSNEKLRDEYRKNHPRAKKE